MITFFKFVTCVFFSPALFLSVHVWADDSPNQINILLKKLSSSLREENYRGLFTYEMGGVLDTYKLIHRVEDGVEYERLFKLNGLQKEVLRSGRRSQCMSRGDQLMQLLAKSAGNSVQGNLQGKPPAGSSLNGQDSAALDQSYYQFTIKETKRVAGRSAIMLQVLPRDQFRYGYVFGLDEASGLPLQILVVNTDGQVLERFQFVELEVGEDVAETELFPSQAEYHRADHELQECDENWHIDEAPWRPTWLPSGFEYTGYKKTRADDFMLSYTDGLASFSVFVGPNESRPKVKGKAQLGSTVAALNHQIWNDQLFCITVVGEIPIVTAVQVAESLELR